MVDVFRGIEHIPTIAIEAIKINARILWTQEGLYSEEAEKIATVEDAINYINAQR